MAGVQSQPCLPPWIPDQVRDDESVERKGRGETQRAQRQRQARHACAADVQGHAHKPSLPPWTPDQVRGDKKRGPLSVLRAFSARSAVTLYLLVSPAKAGVQGYTHHSHLPPWIPDHVRGDESVERKGRGKTQRARRQRQARLSRAAYVQGHTHHSHLPPWTPDQVRGDAAAIPSTPSP